MLTWSNAPVVSDYGPLLTSSEAISGRQHQTTQFYITSTNAITCGEQKRLNYVFWSLLIRQLNGATLQYVQLQIWRSISFAERLGYCEC